MMPKLNIENAIKKGLGLVHKNRRFDISIMDINKIIELSKGDKATAICDAFDVGFYQGYKAAKNRKAAAE